MRAVRPSFHLPIHPLTHPSKRINRGDWTITSPERLLNKDWRKEFIVLLNDSSLVWFKDGDRKSPAGRLILRDAPQLIAYGQYTNKVSIFVRSQSNWRNWANTLTILQLHSSLYDSLPRGASVQEPLSVHVLFVISKKQLQVPLKPSKLPHGCSEDQLLVFGEVTRSKKGFVVTVHWFLAERLPDTQ